MKIVYLGSGQFGIACLDAVKKSRHQLTHIFTQPAHPAGRGMKMTPTSVARWAVHNSIGVTEAANINTAEMVARVRSCNPDLILVIAFGQKISDELIALAPKGMINVHGSILPAYRGAGPINWSIIKGETQTGITIATVTSKMDAGLILATAQIPIEPDDTTETLSEKLSHLAAKPLIETLDKIENGTAVYTPQDETLATKAPKLKKIDGYINFTEPAQIINNKIRGLWPWPGAQCDYISAATAKCCRVIIAKAEVINEPNPNNLPIGIFDSNLNVICGENRLKILQLKPANGHLMDFASFVNGRATQPGDILIPIEK